MALNDKIKCLEELAGVTTAKRAEHKTVVHCHGYFDILHIAAIRHLEEAKKLADVLVVTLAPDECRLRFRPACLSPGPAG